MTRIDRDHLRSICDAHPLATYAELAELSGYRVTTIGRIVRYEFGDERQARLVVVEDYDDFRAGASFAQGDFLASAWWRVWPYGLRVMDVAGDVFEVRGFLRNQTWRQRLVGSNAMIEPVSCNGWGRRVKR